MPNYLFEYQLRIRNAGNTADALTITSVRGGTNPWLSSVPEGDGQEFDPLEGKSRCAAYVGRIADGITSGTDRIVTAQLEDANYRQQLIDRRAFVEYRQDGGSWNVLVAGFLTGLRLVSGAEYEYTVSDPTRQEHDYTAFKPQSAVCVTSASAAIGATSVSVTALTVGIPKGAKLDFGGKYATLTASAAAGATSIAVSALAVGLSSGDRANYSESVASFIARWPYRGCILGGPVRGGFLKQQDRGGWEMSIDGQNSGQALLTFNAGYAAPDFERSTNAEHCMTAANKKTDGLFALSINSTEDSAVTFDIARLASFPGVIVEVMNSAGAAYGYYQAMSGVGYFPFSEFSSDHSGGLQRHLCKDIRHRGIYIGCKTSLAASGLPVAGSSVRVRAFTAEVSEISPIYWTGHPADLLATLWAEAGLSYDASAITTVTNAIGADRRISLRITEPQPLGEFLERVIYGPFGIGVRTDTSGQLVAFSARIPYATAPSTQITSADVDSEESGVMPGEIFAMDQSTAVKKVTYTHSRLVYAQDADDPDAVDGFVEQEERVERLNGDPGCVGNREVAFTIPGMVHSKDGVPNLVSLANAVSTEIFDRWGRGLITGELPLLRGGAGDSAALGDEILNGVPQLPNHNKRLGDDNSVSARAMQIVRSTWTPRGNRVKLADSGPNAQPYATAPTLTIAASASFPRTVAEVTVTNAATLNAASAGLRLQMAVTTGAAPASTDYTDVDAYPAGAIPTTAITLPAVTAGRTVYVRAVATKADKRPSSWSTPANVTLTALTAPSALTATPSGSDGSICALAWTAGDTTSLVDVFLRASGASSSEKVLQRTLPEGSVKFTLEGLTPGVAYTASVQDRDSASGDVSALVDVTFTAGATTLALNAPVYPFGFCGSRDPETGAARRDGVFGIGVVAASFPGFIEVAVATETSVGSGTYGSFVTSGLVMPNVLGNWTTWEDVAPNDGLRRQVKARHVRDGATSSSYCTAQTVTPWTPQALPVYPTRIILSLTQNAPASDTAAQTQMSITATAVDPQGGTAKVALTSLTSNASIASGSAVGTYGSSPQTWVINRPGVLKGSATAVFTADDSAVAGVRNQVESISVAEQGQQGAPVITLTPKPDGTVEVTLTGNNDTDHYTTAESTSSMPSDATARAGTTRSGRVVTFTSTAVLSLGDRYYLKAVPYNAAGTEGQIASGTVDRQNKSTAGKRISFAAAVLATDSSSGTFTRDYDGVSMQPTTGTFTGYGLLTLPNGVTLTGVDSYTFRSTTTAPCKAQYTFVRVVRSTGSATTIATHTHSTTGTQFISTSGLSEAIDNDTYRYMVKGEMDSGGASGGTDACALGDYAATYTSSDLSKSY